MNSTQNGNKKLRRAKPRLIIEWFCEHLTGHEISKTERGFGGGQFMDCNCRWCDKSIQIPVCEVSVSPVLKDLMGLLK